MSIYFDNAATSDPKPPSVVKAVTDALTRCNANPGRSGHRVAIEAGRIVLDIRGEERAGLTVDDLLEKFRVGAGRKLDNDRILLSDKD